MMAFTIKQWLSMAFRLCILPDLCHNNVPMTEYIAQHEWPQVNMMQGTAQPPQKRSKHTSTTTHHLTVRVSSLHSVTGQPLVYHT